MRCTSVSGLAKTLSLDETYTAQTSTVLNGFHIVNDPETMKPMLKREIAFSLFEGHGDFKRVSIK
jgi:hypothetical protein